MRLDQKPRFPLEGIKVIELSSVLAGPSVGQFLAELGATVIKIEPLQGDVTRKWRSKGETNPITAYYACCNWGKKVLPLNLKHPKAIAIVKQLIRQSDVVITNMIHKKLVQYGLHYNAVKHERLIYGMITGFGMESERTGYDACIQAESGFMYLNRENEEALPMKMPVAFMDLLAAHQLKEGILLALYQREKDGKGTFLQVSLLDSGIVSLANQASLYLWSSLNPVPLGSKHPQISPYGSLFRTRDGHFLLLAVGSDMQFQALCKVLKVPELSVDPNFQTNPARVQNRGQLEQALQEVIGQWYAEELVSQLERSQIPYGLVKSVPEALASASSSVYLGGKRALYQAVFEATTWQKSKEMNPPGPLGRDTKEILSQFLGFSEGEIVTLVSEGVTVVEEDER